MSRKKQLDSYHCWQHVHPLPFSEIAESPSPLSSVSTKSVGKTSKINCTTFLRAWQLSLKEAPAPPSLRRSPAGKISLSAPSLPGLHTLLNFTCLNESRLVEYSHQVWTLTQFLFFFFKGFLPAAKRHGHAELHVERELWVTYGVLMVFESFHCFLCFF